MAEPPLAASPAVVAIANHRLAAIGTVRKSLEIAHALAAAGIAVELWVTADGGELRGEAGALSVVVAGGGGGWRAVTALARLLRARRPAVLLSAGKHYHLRAGLALLLSGRRDRTRFVGRASNSLVRPSHTPLQAALSRLAQGLKYRAMDAVILPTHALAAEVAGLPPLPTAPRGPRLVTIRNGVDVAQVRSLAAAAVSHRWLDDPAGEVIVTVGRIDHQKGVDVLLRALARLPAAWRLIVIGSGDPDYSGAMVALAARLGVTERVDFIGYQRNPFAYVARAAVFALASRWEGASNALLEALACGVPVVASDCAGNRELLLDGALGSLARVTDDAALARALLAERATARDPVARERMLAEVTIERCMADYVPLLDPRRPLSRGSAGPVSAAPNVNRFRRPFGAWLADDQLQEKDFRQ